MPQPNIPAKLKQFLLLATCVGMTAKAQTNFSLYSDQLNNGFQNWSWGANNFANPAPVHAGNDSISFAGAAWEAVSFWHSDFNPAPYTNLNFWANGGTGGGQILQIYLEYNNYTQSTPAYQFSGGLPTNGWRQFFISFSTLNAAGITNLSRINVQLTSSGKTGAFYLDDVNLTTVPPSPVHLNINAAQTVRTTDARWFGLNTAVWDGNFDTTTTAAALKEMGAQMLRFPGGSMADFYHWNPGIRADGYQWDPTKFVNFIHIATNTGAQAMITVNYGTGTSNEAAAWVKCANVTNHLAFKYWEIGNENYGSWEADSNAVPHDPYTYATLAKNYIALMKAADPTIKIGVVGITGENSGSNNANHFAVNPRTGTTNYGWTPILLATLKTLGVTPDFLVHHVYPEYQSDSDQKLLQASANWAIDAADLRQQIADYFGSGGTNIELLCTENNADAGNQGKQSTSIVNGLYLADSLAQMMKTEFNAFVWWDLRNGTDTGGDFNASLYGWRTYGDLGIINGLNTRHPVYYTFKLMQYLARPGDTVLNPASDYFLLPVYSTRKADGSLAVLVINKDNATPLNAQLSLTNFLPWTNALVRQFGIAQDEATRTNSVAPGAQDIATNNFAIAGTNFTAAFPPYSVTLFTIPPAAPKLAVLPPTNGLFNLQVQGQANVRYVLQSTTNLSVGNWTAVATNTLTNAVWNVSTNHASPAKFWRAVWQPLN